MGRNPLNQLASVGEDLLEKASQNPRTAKIVQSANDARNRVDDLAKRVRGLEALEKRIAELESRVQKLETKKSAAARKPTPESPG
jgi:hypothetical protein